MAAAKGVRGALGTACGCGGFQPPATRHKATTTCAGRRAPGGAFPVTRWHAEAPAPHTGFSAPAPYRGKAEKWSPAWCGLGRTAVPAGYRDAGLAELKAIGRPGRRSPARPARRTGRANLPPPAPRVTVRGNRLDGGGAVDLPAAHLRRRRAGFRRTVGLYHCARGSACRGHEGTVQVAPPARSHQNGGVGGGGAGFGGRARRLAGGSNPAVDDGAPAARRRPQA